ncbi:MAG: cysteine desulfurase [Krumholzibacteria bacterium]|nr:cysteine desulfurase [Candidatus Krumholzibacteria bacterium]
MGGGPPAKGAAVQAPDPIYLDYNATTPIDPRVVQAMLPWLTTHFGNPSSPHVYGRRARAAVERARAQVAALVGAEPAGVVFTSGGTEANNHALRGALRLRGAGRLVTGATEHPAVLAVCRDLEREGTVTTLLPVDGDGRVGAAAAARAIGPGTVLVSLMLANNEVGTLQPVAEVARLARAAGALSHSDCAQAAGKVPVGLDDLGVDMISLAGHKLYAPKGVGALCLRPGLALPNLMHGAGHEGGRRPGTENVASIVGLGEACALAAQGLQAEAQRLQDLRDRLAAALLADFPEAVVHGAGAPRLPNTLSIAFPGRTAAAILARLYTVAVSAGAACHGDRDVGSHVLAAMGVPPLVARGTLRVSLGRMTTPAQTQAAAAAIAAAVRAAA